MKEIMFRVNIYLGAARAPFERGKRPNDCVWPYAVHTGINDREIGPVNGHNTCNERMYEKTQIRWMDKPISASIYRFVNSSWKIERFLANKGARLNTLLQARNGVRILNVQKTCSTFRNWINPACENLTGIWRTILQDNFASVSLKYCSLVLNLILPWRKNCVN